MTPKQKREHLDNIRRAFYEAESLCHKYSGWNDLRLSVETASKQEREHRAMGRRMIGDIGKRPPIERIAQMFALKGFLTPERQRRFDNRKDFVLAYGAAQGCCRQPEGKAEWAKFCRKWRKVIGQFDYSDLIG